MSDESEAIEFRDRLRKIEGQLGGIRRMVQDGRSCLEIIQQVSAARAAVNRSSLRLLRRHVIEHVVEAPADDREERVRLDAELKQMIGPFLHR